MKLNHATAGSAVGIAALIALAACAPADSDVEATAGTTADAHEEHADDHHDENAESSAQEASARTPRLVATYDGGVVVLDATTLEVEGDIAIDGFNRVSPAGDGRHVAVSTEGGWAILDAGTWSQEHGDHYHYYVADPALTDLFIDATTPGHVVPHDGLTALWDDGTGKVQVVETSEWTDMVDHEHLHTIREWTAEEAHHGVAAASETGELLVTRGNEDERTGAMLLDAEDAVLASSDECPGVHGETAFTNAEGEEFFMVGCQDGALAFHGDHVHKLSVDGDFGRIGNLHAFDGSDVVLGDYKSDPEGGLGLSEISILNPEEETITVVNPFGDADASYTWRGIRRGSEGELLVLGSDGVLRTLDESGEVLTETAVIDAWDVPEEWQTAHPSLTIVDGMAYVADPATETVHIVDYVTGEVWKSVEVGFALNEVTSVTG